MTIMCKKSDLRTFGGQYSQIFLPFLLIVTAFPSLLHALDMRAGRRVTIPAGEVVSTNLYIAAGEIYFSGTVNGDLSAAGGEISLDGTVANDVTAGGGQIRVNAQIGGD